MENRYDYYYGKDAEQFRYNQIPKELLDNPEFSSLTDSSREAGKAGKAGNHKCFLTLFRPLF